MVYAQVKDAFLDSVSTASGEEYILPYPGLLPDSPLYIAKVIRDRIIEFLIADSLKKSEFYLLESDKRLQAGIMLLKKRADKSELAYSTISKSENYFEKAIMLAKDAKTQGKDIANQAQNLVRSLKKHRAILASLLKTGPKNLKEQFMHSDKRLRGFDGQVSIFLSN